MAEHLNRRAITFSEFIPIWRESLSYGNRARQDTIKKYIQQLSHIEPYIGAMDINRIRPEDMEGALISLEKQTSLGPSTINKVFACTRRVFRFANARGYTDRNPCDTVRAPKPSRPDRRSLSIDEAKRLFACLDSSEADEFGRYLAKESRQAKAGNYCNRSMVLGISKISDIWAVRLALVTGMRISEVCALTWSNVDLSARKINVTCALGEQGPRNPDTGWLMPRETKTIAARRTITIDARTAGMLATWKLRQASMLACINVGDGPYDNGTKHPSCSNVCCSCTGGPIRPSLLERWWRTWRRNAGFPELKLHELRHTQATILLGCGIDIPTVQIRLGHDSASTTLHFYAHALPDNDELAASVIGEKIAEL